MTRRRTTVAAWGLCALTLLATAAGGLLTLAVAGTNWAAILPQATPPSESAVLTVLDLCWLLAFAVVGAIVASHQPRNPVGWLLGAIPLLMTSILLGESVYWYAARDHPGDPGLVAELGLWSANVAWFPAVLVILVFLPLLFPTGRPPTPRWRIVGWAAATGGVLLFGGTAFVAGPLENYRWVRQPARCREHPRLRPVDRLRPLARDRGGGGCLGGRPLPPLARRGAPAAQVVHRRGGAARLAVRRVVLAQPR